MSAAILTIAAAVGAGLGSAIQFECDIARPDGGNFILSGTFDGVDLKQSNVGDLIASSGAEPVLDQETEISLEGVSSGCIVNVSSDSTVCDHNWSLSGRNALETLRFEVTEWPQANVAALAITNHLTVGRHGSYGLFGVGLCKTKRVPLEDTQ